MNRDRRNSKQSLETRAIHAGNALNPLSSLAPPIVQSSTFKLADAAQGAELANAFAPPAFYTRWGNPTTKQAERVLADLEGSEAALLFSSGMGAISALMLASLAAGDHVIVGRSIYSGVSELVKRNLSRYGVESSFVDAGSLGEIESALRDSTKLIFVETPTNPTLSLCDLEAIGRLGRERDVRTAVDNTFATPVNQRPLELGVDVVVHAATKYLGGHSDLTAGVVCSSLDVVKQCWAQLKLLGASISPFESWLLLRGLKTLCVRVRQQNCSALELAKFLEARAEVRRVHYPGLPSHPQHDLARRQMDSFGGMVSFELDGGVEQGVRFVEALELIQLAVSLGGVESIIQHPASMTHGMLPEEDVRAAGISPGLLRLSVGLESVEDLQRDLARGFAAAG